MENDKPRKMPNVPPFVKFVCANVPMVFDDSLSYYEALCALWKYVQECVNAINNNATLEEEYIEKFDELKEFVDNYFVNLDVQQEINNKLDQMVEDGTIKSLINNEIFGEINSKVLQNTLDISANTEAIEGKVSEGEANSITMSMLTQDVREAMTGGSTAVVGENSVDTVNIADGAVTIFKLDNYLQSTKTITYSEPLALGVTSAGIAAENPDTHKVYISGPTSTSYSWYKVALTKGKIYAFSGYTYGTCSGILIANSDDDVLWSGITGTTPSYTMHPYSAVFRANSDNLYAYMDIVNSNHAATFKSVIQTETPMLREISNMYNVYKKMTPVLVDTIEDHYLSVSHVSGQNMPVMEAISDIDLKIYEMSKGVKYHISGWNYSAVSGVYILGLDNTIIYQSSNSSVGNNWVAVDYTFTASADGYIYLASLYGTHLPSIEIIDEISGSGSGESVNFSKWFALGDSLTEVNFRASDNYASYIADELGITLENLGHSGCGYMKTASGNNFRTEINEITGYNYNTDIITVMGSINDFSYIATALGELGDTGTDTIYGCMYNFFSDLQTAYMGVRLGVITLPPAGTNRDTFFANANLYNTALKETAKMFDVPVLDLTYNCNLKPWESNFRNEFYSADGTGSTGQVDDTHPNSKGHWLIHNKIKEFLKTL